MRGEIRIIGDEDKKEEGEEGGKLEEVVSVSDVVELEVEEGVEAQKLRRRTPALSVVRVSDLDTRFLTQ